MSMSYSKGFVHCIFFLKNKDLNNIYSPSLNTTYGCLITLAYVEC